MNNLDQEFPGGYTLIEHCFGTFPTRPWHTQLPKCEHGVYRSPAGCQMCPPVETTPPLPTKPIVEPWPPVYVDPEEERAKVEGLCEKLRSIPEEVRSDAFGVSSRVDVLFLIAVMQATLDFEMACGDADDGVRNQRLMKFIRSRAAAYKSNGSFAGGVEAKQVASRLRHITEDEVRTITNRLHRHGIVNRLGIGNLESASANFHHFM
jgi:hypothetical protein